MPVCPTNKLVNNNSRKLQGASFRDMLDERCIAVRLRGAFVKRFGARSRMILVSLGALALMDRPVW